LPTAGVGGQRIFHIQNRGLCAAVSPSRHRQYDVTEKNLKTHESVIQAYMAKYPVLPYRINTVVGERVGRGVLQKYHAALSKDLQGVQNRRQFRVRVIRRKAGPGEKPIGSLLAPSEMKARMSDYIGSAKRSAPRKTYVLKPHVYKNMVHGPLEGIADRTKNGSLAGSHTVVDSLYLVHKSQTNDFRNEYLHLQQQFQELEFFLTGPEPPYDFTSVSIVAGNKWD